MQENYVVKIEFSSLCSSFANINKFGFYAKVEKWNNSQSLVHDLSENFFTPDQKNFSLFYSKWEKKENCEKSLQNVW